MGPILIHSQDEYRIESFFEGRPLSIWEMRNPFFMSLVANALCDYNFNRTARGLMPKLDENKLEIDKAIKEWAPSVIKRMPGLK